MKPNPFRNQRGYDVVIVGAGAAGVGMGVILHDLGVSRYVLLEREQVGASFTRWPEEMRFITPSFTSNGFGLLDLNAVAIGTSPAYTLGVEHPSGQQYARYLQAVADHFELPVRTGVDVQRVEPLPRGEGFRLRTTAGEIHSRFVIWAAGEFQYPNLVPFPGAELCRHNATISVWSELEGDDFIVIGGYESGIDAAIHLSQLGKRVRVLDDRTPWAADEFDPSLALSPYTRQRLQRAQFAGRISLIGARVSHVLRNGESYEVISTDGQRWKTLATPILASGFISSLVLVDELFDRDPEQHYPLLTDQDESTRTPGLFLVGPQVRHGGLIFCFIYKFRQRFAVVANAIGQRLGLDTAHLEAYRQHQMYLDDLSCCDDACAC